MGMFDKMFAPEDERKVTFADFATAMVPFVGPFMARNRLDKRAQKGYDNWLSDNLAYTDPSELGESGRQVQQRMLERTGGELSTQGLMAATAMQRAAQNPENQANLGNVLMETSNALAANGQPQAALTLGATAHKNYQTPWKPSESRSANVKRDTDTGIPLTPQGTLMPNATGYTRADNVEVGDETQSGYWITKTGPNGELASREFVKQTAGERYRPGTVNVSMDGLDGILTKSDVSKSVLDAGAKINAQKDTERVFAELSSILKASPNGVTGWGGAITGFMGKAANLAGFLQQSTSRFNADGESEAAVIGRFTGDISKMIKEKFPLVEQAKANSLIIGLAYAIARMNNMGTAGGGRGITDADMKFALQQLGASSTPEAMIKVLESEQRRARARLRDDMRNTDLYIKSIDPKKGLPPEWLRDLEDMPVPGADEEAALFKLYGINP